MSTWMQNCAVITNANLYPMTESIHTYHQLFFLCASLQAACLISIGCDRVPELCAVCLRSTVTNHV